MKKAQMKMMETIAVIFIFFVLVLFGIIFFYQYSKVSINERNEQFFAERAMRTTLKVLFMPELICTDHGRIEQNCFDLQKVEAAKEVIERNTEDYYFNLFSYAEITVHQLTKDGAKITDPTELEENKYPIYYKPKTPYLNKKPTYFIVALKDERTDSYDFGYLEVIVYS